jgi:hypothetical protein
MEIEIKLGFECAGVSEFTEIAAVDLKWDSEKVIRSNEINLKTRRD